MNCSDSFSILRSQSCYYRGSVCTQCTKGLQIGLNASAAARIRTRYRQCDGRFTLPGFRGFCVAHAYSSGRAFLTGRTFLRNTRVGSKHLGLD